MKDSGRKIELKGYDDIFTPDAATATGEQVRQIPTDQLFPFKDHPFKVTDDQAMQDSRLDAVPHGCGRALDAVPDTADRGADAVKHGRYCISDAVNDRGDRVGYTVDDRGNGVFNAVPDVSEEGLDARPHLLP